MKYSLIILSSIMILLSSCDYEKTVDIGDVSITPHMVINGLIYANSDTSYLQITESSPIYNNTFESGFNIIENANVDFYLNNTLHPIQYNKADSAYVLVEKIKSRDRINITSNYSGKKISSIVEVPDAPEIISVDTTHIKKIEDHVSGISNFILFNIKIKDKSNNKDYYHLLVQNKFIEVNTIYSYPYDGTCYSDDPLLSGAYKVFRDVSFDGKEYNLKFYVKDYAQFFEGESDTKYLWQLSVKLQKINEDLYKYYSSLQSSYENGESKLVYSNIEGGLGILGTCNEINIFENNIFN
ncbi:DUF4249 domain-containing protein [Dysgonomonas capnocytophagoides]|uniref:DUF4249 domain-containing protein n=1 Tax=Dysgonomonas capnocytophagoides TaxID=45254 RepID=UPI002920F00E|nr:hypothetical protein DCPSUM001_12150 [Dysgonomonas capnocytophagoides]